MAAITGVSLVLALTPTSSPASEPPATEAREDAPPGPGQGRLILDGSAVGVEVVIRDAQEPGRERSLGRVPLTIDLPAGHFELSVDEPGYVPWRAPIEIVEGVATSVAVEPELIDVGLIVAEQVSESAIGAELRIDGERACALPCRTTATPGNHRVEIRKRKHKPLVFELELTQADSVELVVTLERATSRAPAIITGSVAAVALGTAIVFTARADATRRSLAADLADHTQYDATDARIDVGRRDAVIGSALFGVTAIAAGLTLYYLLRQPGEPSRVEKRRKTLAAGQLVPAIGPSGAGLVGEFRF